jgi:hypothetical protein
MILLRWDLYTITAIYRMVGVGSRNVCLGIADTWRDVQLSNSTKLLPIPYGHAHDTMAGLMNARFRLL